MAATTNHVFRTVDGKVKKVAAEAPTVLKPEDVLLKITHSGLCSTDVFYIPSGMALGHEGVGIFRRLEVQSRNSKLEIGLEAVIFTTCGKCKYCLSGHKIYCYTRDIYGEASFNTGTFSDYYTGVETYLHKIPDSISSSDAASLQCAGATVYSALMDVAKPGSRVGVVGIGGLRHLAIQFAAKLGAEVIVFSTSAQKEEEERKFGATESYLLSKVEALAEPIDVLVLTGNKYPDFAKFLTKEILARTGTVVPLTASGDNMDLPAMQMFFGGYNIHSSLVASRKVHSDMSKFAALHSIKPTIEEFAMDEAGWAKALEELTSGKVRYRAVLVNE